MKYQVGDLFVECDKPNLSYVVVEIVKYEDWQWLLLEDCLGRKDKKGIKLIQFYIENDMWKHYPIKK